MLACCTWYFADFLISIWWIFFASGNILFVFGFYTHLIAKFRQRFSLLSFNVSIFNLKEISHKQCICLKESIVLQTSALSLDHHYFLQWDCCARLLLIVPINFWQIKYIHLSSLPDDRKWHATYKCFKKIILNIATQFIEGNIIVWLLKC